MTAGSQPSPSSPWSGPRLVVLASGSGTNLAAVLDACATRRLEAEVVLVVSNRPDAYALERAAVAGVATAVRSHRGVDRADYDRELADLVAGADPDLVVLAGWDRLLTNVFLSRHRVINLHPAQPGAFPGLGAIEAAYRAWTADGVTAGGVMVHFVPDEGVDDGPTIVWEEVPIEPGDSLASFEDRVHRTEHRLLVEAIATVLDMPQPSAPPSHQLDDGQRGDSAHVRLS